MAKAKSLLMEFAEVVNMDPYMLKVLQEYIHNKAGYYEMPFANQLACLPPSLKNKIANAESRRLAKI